MEERVQVREWARLKLVGRPVMTSRDLWVAVRPLPRLLHLYYDSTLRALLRFPEDPIFLMFAPSRDETCDGEESEPGFTSLLVITSDGCLWWISHINSYKPTDRPSKRLKQDHLRESKFKKGTEEDWDIFEDCDIYKDTDLYPSHDVLTGSELPSAGSTKAHLLCKLLNFNASENAFRKVRARCVQPENLVGMFPGACVAAAGPDKLIAVASYSRSPILLTGANLLSTDISPAQGTSSSNDCHSDRKTPSSLLFATMKNNEHRSQWGAVILSPKLFNVLLQGFVGPRPKHLLLQGNSAGEVHIFPIDLSNQISSSSMILCDLQEPISELVAYPLYNDSDALLVLTSHGCLIAITPSRCKSTNTPFFLCGSEFSVWKLFRIDMKDIFDVHSWRVKAPLVSATLYGSEHLCFCSASSVCVVTILKNVDGKPPQKSSYTALTRADSEEVFRKDSLVCKTIPLHDIFVAVTGQGPFVATKTRSLVALNSRGRLVGLEISDDVLLAQKECFILKGDVKSWKPRVKKRDENVMVLLDEIAAIESCTEALQVMKKSIELAISELAIALRLTCDVLSSRDRYTVRAPHRSNVVPLMTGLHCKLEVNPVMPTVALKRLCFSSDLNTQTSKSRYQYTEQSINLKLCLKVTLFNCSTYPVSSYWTLLLDIHGLKEASATSRMYFSSVINDGYGLAPGASSEMAFQVSCAEESLNLFEASVYLCHIHENHHDVLQATPTLMKTFLQPMEAISSRCAAENLHSSSRAACILLARYRVDILSLLRPPQRLQHSSDLHSSHFLCPRGMGADEENHGTHKLRPFSMKFQLSFTRRCDLSTWTKLNDVEKWKEIQLEHLMKCCALSKDGQELRGTDVHGNTVLLSLDNKHLGKEGLFSREIQISTPSPFMGCMVREAVLWCLKQDFRFQEIVKPADERGSSQNMDMVLDLLVDTQKRLDFVMRDAENLASLWHANHLEQSDSAAQWMREAYITFKHILEMYMSYRENGASNPFWRFAPLSS